ncbi:hypothetical protein [Paenibacillus sp. HB172176]|uniref:hypothetical protein n=1 Tax=Paenibacillus sp. HB172176 TaxID=2493690 RepID=UPI001438D9B0|nr:hypothetical protein [Paenibacillus sp. HB172176]
MTNVTKQRYGLWFLMMMTIFLIDTTLVRTVPSTENNRILAYAVIFDFALVIPLLYWWLIARRKAKPVWKAAPFTALGAVAAWLALPVTLKNLAFAVMWPVELLIVALEVVFIGFEIRILYRFIGSLRRVRRIEPEASEALRIAIREQFGNSRLAALAMHDASLIHFLLFSWKRQAKTKTAEPVYTYHRKTSLILYAGIITHVLVFEAVILHLLVSMWSPWAAWALTALDVWLLALIWADCRASVLRPIRLGGHTLRIRYGLRIQMDVPLEAVAEITSNSTFEPDTAEQKSFALPILGTPNVRIEFHRPLPVNGFLFLPRKVEGVYLVMDDPQAFVGDVRAALETVSRD